MSRGALTLRFVWVVLFAAACIGSLVCACFSWWLLWVCLLVAFLMLMVAVLVAVFFGGGDDADD